MAEEMTEGQVLDLFSKYEGQPAADAQQPPAETRSDPEQPEGQVDEENAPQEVKAEEPQKEVQEDTQTIEIDPEEPLFEQEVHDGDKKVTQKLSLKELQQGYLRQSDYQRKTQELARQREELPQTLSKQTQELSQSYAKRLTELQALVMNTVAADIQGHDLNKLATEDPLEWVRVSNRANQVNQLLQTIQQQQSQETQRLEAEKQQKAAQEWSKSVEILQRDIPNFGSDVVKRIFETGKGLGFTEQELGELRDHRIIKLLHAQSEKQSLETKRPQIEKKVALVTKTLKPGTQQQRSGLSDAMRKLAKSGKPEDALPIFEAFTR